MSCLFSFCPGSASSLISLLEFCSFSIPIYVSSASHLGRLGGFPTNKGFRAFLLSESGGIILIKDPIGGSGVTSLCESVLLTPSAIPVVQASISVSRHSIGFPGVTGSDVRCSFPLGGINGGGLLVGTMGIDYKYASMSCAGRPVGPNSSNLIGIFIGGSGSNCFGSAVAICYGTSSDPLILGLCKGTVWVGWLLVGGM